MSDATVLEVTLQRVNHGKLNSLMKYPNAENSSTTRVDANWQVANLAFAMEQYIKSRAQPSFLTHKQLDLVLMGSVLSTVNASDKSVGSQLAKQQRITVTFMHRGYHLCKATYTFLYGVNKHSIQSIKEHILEHGLVT